MNKNILIAFVILIGLVFSSCKNSSSENKETLVVESEEMTWYNTNDIEKEELAERVKDYITTQFLTEADKRAISEDQRKFQLYTVDLNNDGSEEIFVNFVSSYFCGSGGCTVLLLNKNLELITRFSPTQTLYVGRKVENGWSILHTRADGEWKKLVYEDDTYPSNPTMVDGTDEEPNQKAVKLFDEDDSKQKMYSF